MISVALRKDGLVRQWVESSETFTLNQVASGQKALVRHFARGFAPDTPAFDGLSLRSDLSTSGPVLADAVAYLDAKVVASVDGSDHRVFVAEVVAGALLNPASEPMVHVRHNGFHY
jgi:flavin reductase (DIM6/NTAB) family NADH-FMN oxidoreductase RutF